MSIQSDWHVYCRSVISDFGDQLTEDHLSLLRHAFFCGASVTFADVMASARQGTAAEAMLAIRKELDFFMAERSDASVRVH